MALYIWNSVTDTETKSHSAPLARRAVGPISTLWESETSSHERGLISSVPSGSFGR
jgi:hypothetical protein